MIRRPAPEDFRERAAVTALRDAGDLVADSTRGARRYTRRSLYQAWWCGGVPLVFGAAHYVLQGRWPEVFQTAWAVYALVAGFAWVVWTKLVLPQTREQVDARMKQNTADIGEDVLAMRAELERTWAEKEKQP